MALIECSECGKEVSDKAAACPHCGAPINIEEAQPVTAEATSKSTVHMSPPAILGLAGAGLMAFGVFLPFVKVPLFGSLNLFKNGSGDGVIILLLAALVALFLLLRKWVGAMIPAILSSGILIYDIYDFHRVMGTARSDMERQLADNPFRGLADGMVNSISLDIGTFVVGLGAVLCIAAAIWGRSQVKAEH